MSQFVPSDCLLVMGPETAKTSRFSSIASRAVMRAPLRFLAKEEVRTMPVIGQIAKSIGCVFVKRENKESRAEARAALAQQYMEEATALGMVPTEVPAAASTE